MSVLSKQHISGKITDDEQNEIYMFGRCMFLALAFHDLFGFTIESAFYDDGTDGFIDHSWVIAGSNAVDTDGVHELEKLPGQWRSKHVTIS